MKDRGLIDGETWGKCLTTPQKMGYDNYGVDSSDDVGGALGLTDERGTTSS